MYKGKTVGVIIAAAGSGTRMNGGKEGLPKQFMTIGGVPMVKKTLAIFEENEYVDDICVVINGKYWKTYEELLDGFRKIRCMVPGGKERQESVGAGLRELSKVSEFDYVMIHDCARPYVTDEIIEASLEGVMKHNACTAAVPVKDTIRNGGITLERDNLFIVQTPQTFERNIITEAYNRAWSDGYYGTDDGSLVERLGLPVALIPGSYSNFKITTREDLPMETRIGTGYDVHRLVPGRRLVLGGVEIEYEKGLLGHSDADVLLHAISDALLGAAALGDIGQHFPDSDPRYKGISSLKLLAHAGELLRSNGYEIGNIDATLIAERPKISPYKERMRNNIADALLIDPERVSVKATTEEGLGFTGRGEGIAAQAVCTLQKN
ncbi:MAG: 2-C-methyl-D-erythritol 2,4-cyclodiphosphate synthase [Firmicutes bacterium]|nr:2-C-methyl-D-erythritol 2,4-cyclodiphosphate synthase [Bacillota bacterium]MBQ9972184.1 2-C-methyl-D-erythritol 2,4-cyclodiphosphate synthase [Bacillota bacterium]